MTDEKDQIKELIITKPKHYAKMVKNNPVLWNWVQANSTTIIDSLPAQIYSAITGTSDQCPNGSHYKLKSAVDGWVGCGRASVCTCVRESTSASVSASKALHTTEEKAETNKKRVETNLKKYGVENVGQSEKARQNHLAFYDDSTNVQRQVDKQESTMISKYGCRNAAHLDVVVEKKKSTNLERYGVENPMQNSDVAKRSGENRMNLWDPTKLFQLNYDRVVARCKSEWNVRPLISKNEYRGIDYTKAISWECLSCGHTYDKRLWYGCPPICRICNPPEVKYESQEEISLRNFIKSVYSGPVVVRDRSLINPYELDIVLPDLKLAIDYGGLYWHSQNSANKTWDYHERKMLITESVGLRLLTIFSDEWLLRREQVENKLRSIIGVSTTKIGARQCTTQKISRQEAILFHDQHHIQGAARRSPINYGLFFNNVLVSVASFVKTGTDYYLTRFSSSVQVIGGCSKLLNYHVDCEGSAGIITYADLRWSQGHMYQLIGFEEVGRVEPTYDYVGNNYTKRYDAQSYPKTVLGKNYTKNQRERMQNLGYDRIWDCGKIKFRLDSPFTKSTT